MPRRRKAPPPAPPPTLEQLLEKALLKTSKLKQRLEETKKAGASDLEVGMLMRALEVANAKVAAFEEALKIVGKYG